jgi:hypothetical protein
MEVFYKGKQSGKFAHVVSIGLEGPVLASHGGTPETGVWAPTKQHWKELSACGKKGLIYVILSPDAQLPPSLPDVPWITATLLSGGVLPAPGHFTKADPISSAKSLQHMFDQVASWGQSPTITDHMFNDMPHNFKHAWRTPREKANREQDLDALRLDLWDMNLLEEQLGPVPAVMIKNARRGIVKICQNFDGEHVDLAVVKKTVELVGPENMLMMTDSIESKCLAGRALKMGEGSTLLYQEQDIVAAGSQTVQHQIFNMIAIGLSQHQITTITSSVPSEIIARHSQLTLGMWPQPVCSMH